MQRKTKGLWFKAHKVSIKIKRIRLGCWESREGIVGGDEEKKEDEEKIEGAKKIFLVATKTKKKIKLTYVETN